MKIIVDEQKARLYIFLKKPVAYILFASHIVSIVKNTFDIWHYRWGHLSSAKLQFLNHSIPEIKSDCSFNCYLLAKQKKFIFPTSTSTSKSILQLIHFDIWKPFSIPCLDDAQYFLSIVGDFSDTLGYFS